MKVWLFRRRRQEEELEREIEAHLAMAARDRMERGEAPQAAEQAARREFGNQALVKETTRDMWGWNALERFLQDVSHALRGMRRSPGFTAMAIASLALGLGANTAIFSLMNTVMFRLLPVRHPEQLVELLQKYPGEPRGNGYWTWSSYQYFRDHNTSYAALIGTSIDNLVRFRTEHRGTQTVIGEYVTGNYFSELGLKPATGRLIAAEDHSMGAAGAVAVVSWSCWKTKFNLDPDIVGKRIFVQEQPVTVIGVAPRGFVGPRIEAATEVWLPRKPNAQMGLALLGRLKPGVTLAKARAEIPVLYRFTIEERAARSSDPLVRQLKAEVEPAGNGLSTVRDRIGKPLSVLMAIVGLLLVITCVNIAGLLLARGAHREREMAVRAGLGASRSRLVIQVMTEALLLSTLGTAAGVVVAYFATTALLAVLASGRLHEQVHLRVQPDLHVLVFAAGIAIAAALLFGLAPALHATRRAPVFALRQAGVANETRFRRRFGKSLVALQVAFSVLLLSTGALFVEHLWNLEHKYLGFHRDHVLLVTLDPIGSGYSGARLAADYQELLSRLQRIPGVLSASICAPTPLSGAGASGLATVDGYQERASDRRWIAISRITPQYFETIGSPLLAGRDFTAQDQKHSRVAIINQTMARHYFANRNPIGQRVTLDHVTLDPQPKSYEIVGVAGDANYSEIREPKHSSIYLPAFHDDVVSANNFALRTSIGPKDITGDVRSTIRQVVKGIAISRVITLSDQIDASIVPERLIATLSGFFAALAALLVGIGIYGLLAYTVARRTNEIGIRMALGATASKVSRMVLLDAVVVVIAGLVPGIPMAIYGRELAARVVPDISVQTVIPFVSAAVVIVAGAILAAYLPARRAAHVDPIEALRHE